SLEVRPTGNGSRKCTGRRRSPKQPCFVSPCPNGPERTVIPPRRRCDRTASARKPMPDHNPMLALYRHTQELTFWFRRYGQTEEEIRRMVDRIIASGMEPADKPADRFEMYHLTEMGIGDGLAMPLPDPRVN